MNADVYFMNKKDSGVVLQGIYRNYTEYIHAAKKFVSDIFNQPHQLKDYSRGLVVKVKGKIVGSIFYKMSFLDDNICEASFLWIDSAYRHEGLAMLLITSLKNELDLMAEALRPVMLIASINKKAYPVYKEFKFKKLFDVPFTDNIIIGVKIKQ